VDAGSTPAVFPPPPAEGPRGTDRLDPLTGADGGGRAAPATDTVRAAAFEQFFETHHRDLARYAYLLTGDRDLADDITAEALTSTWTHWDRVQAADSPIAYVRRTVANLAAGRVRRAVRDRTLLARLGRQLPSTQSTPDRDVPAAVDIESALMRLPLRKRQCVVLRYCLDLSEAETASQLRISVGTVKSQTSKGVAELERLLSGSSDQHPRHQRAARSRRSRPSRRASSEPSPSPFMRLRGGQA
jgi:RNA polymerase sigma-70 factor (sigma-E family)